MISIRDSKLTDDLATLARFIEIYCDAKHSGMQEKEAVSLKHFDVTDLAGHPIRLCPSCRKLLTHAFTKRANCPLAPKPACKRCPQHCYHPEYRVRIREVMAFSGRKLVLAGRLDYLFHLLF